MQFKKFKCTIHSCISISQTFKNISGKKNYSNVPENVKVTMFENWVKYWKNLYADYKEVTIDVYKYCKLHPIKASMYGLFSGSLYYCSVKNPNKISFREQLIQSSLKLSQIGEPVRNPVSVCYVKWLEQCHNEGILRRFNLGIVSFLWLDDYDRTCALYKTICPYLKPRYINFYQRIVDVGFLSNWWVLHSCMIDYDINDTENLGNTVM